MKTRDLLGQTFGKLNIISQAPNILAKNGTGKSVVAWNCQCECGKIVVVRGISLVNGKKKSCGCDYSGTALEADQKNNRLTTIKYLPGAKWICKCDCGKEVIVPTQYFITGNAKSCGCLKSEKASQNIRRAIKASTKYPPHITTARRMWKSYHYQDPLCSLSFNEWYDISQMECFYCGIFRSNTHNAFLLKKDASSTAKRDGYFSYNGLDRIDSSLPHSINNVVASCWPCNSAKSNHSTETFINQVMMMRLDNVFAHPIKLLKLPTGYMLASVNNVYRDYTTNYESMDIDKQTFYTYSQLPCFYCSKEKSNHRNPYLSDKKMSQAGKDGAHFYYNGIDRRDSSLGHTLENVVPCCWFCNRIKSDLSLKDFAEWINRIQSFQKQKQQSMITTTDQPIIIL